MPPSTPRNFLLARFSTRSVRAFAVLILYFVFCQHVFALDPALPAKLKDHFSAGESKFGSAVILSAIVQEVGSNNIIFSTNAAQSMKPASLVKLVTTLTALRTLSGGYRFPTEIFVDNLPAELASPQERGQKRVDFSEPVFEVGNIYIRGYGDPTFDSERLFALAESISRHGIWEVNNLVVDDTLFLDPPRPKSEKPHDAGLGAVSVNYNAYSAVVAPVRLAEKPHVTLTPGVGFQFFNQTKSTHGASMNVDFIQNPTSASVQALGDDADLLARMSGITVLAKGNVGTRAEPESFYFSVPDPGAYAGSLLKYSLQRVGVTVKGKVVRGETPAQAKSLELLLSKGLNSILQEMNHSSSNVLAGQIVYSLGQDSRGIYRYDLGMRRIIETMENLRFSRGSFELVDGSGLDHRNRLSAEQILAVILEAYKDFSVAPDFIASLSRFGQSGTLKLRQLLSPEVISQLRGDELRAVRRKANAVWAKTGTLSGVSALAGVLETMTDERLAFVVMANVKSSESDKGTSLEESLVDDARVGSPVSDKLRKEDFAKFEDEFVRILINLPELKPRIAPQSADSAFETNSVFETN